MAAKQKNTTTQGANRPSPTPKKVTNAPVFERTNTFQSGFWSNHWLAAVLLMAVPFALYAATLGFGYVLDDEMVIQKNVFTQKGFGGLRDIFRFDSFMGYFQKKESLYLLEGGRYRPLSLATFAMEMGFFGKDNPNLPYISHFFNVLLYGLTGVLLYRILLGLFPVREGGRWFFSLAFVASLLFVLHPLHVEAVANIKGRDEILALLFSLSSLYATLKYFDTGRTRWMIGSGLFMLLGLFAKENALTFLAVIPLTVVFFTRVGTTRALTASVPLLVAALVFIVIRFRALGFMLDHGKAMTDLMNDPFLGMKTGEKLATTFLTLGWYIKLLFYPHPLTHDYYPYHVPKVNWSDWRPIVTLVVYMAMGIWAVLNLRKRKVAAWCILYYLLTLSIVSNLFVSVGTFMNERFLYMSSVGFCVLIAWLLCWQVPQWFKAKADQWTILGIGLLAIMAAGFGWRTFTRIPDWKDAPSLNRAAVKVSEGSARSHVFYVTSLYQIDYRQENLSKEEKERLVTEMEYHLDRATAINPNYGAAYQMKAGIAAARFELDHQLDKLFHEFEDILEHTPYNKDTRKFLADYMKYLDGSNADKYMAFCYRTGYEFFFKKKNDTKSALEFLQYGIDRQYEDIRLLESAAEVYQAMGNTAKAQEMQQRAQAQK